jgi:hypothetical protein
LQGDAELVREFAGLSRFDGVAEVLPYEELHHHEGPAFFFAEVEDLDDVLVLDVAGHASFLEKARFGFRVGASLFGEDLDGYGAADDGVARSIDVRHTAAQELFELILSNTGRKLHLFRHLRDTTQPGKAAFLEESRGTAEIDEEADGERRSTGKRGRLTADSHDPFEVIARA